MAKVEEKVVGALPHWDMTPYFGGLDSQDFDEAFRELLERIGRLRDLYDEHGVRGGEITLDDRAVAAFEEVVTEQNSLLEDLRIVNAYLYSFISTDSRNEAAQARLSEMQMHAVELQRLEARFKEWIAALGADGIIEGSEVARDHAFAVKKAEKAAALQMSESEEDLFATLRVTGGTAWSKLYQNVTSRLTAEVEKPGGSERLPISKVRALAQDPDPEVRRAAYQAELKAWETVEVPLAAAINSIKGETSSVADRRGFEDALATALFQNNVDRETLEAMQSAVVESFPDFRRYLESKAKLLGKPALAFYDLFAPVGDPAALKEWGWNDATGFITEQFEAYSPRLGSLAQRAFSEGWVDAEPREGKSDGAFCMGVRGEDSRVLMNFSGSFNSVQTLAHELGHAFHNINLATRTPLQRQTPMALAETASIFCQTMVGEAGKEEASDAERLVILEGELQGSCQVVVDIHSRFLFERGVLERRRERELSVTELKQAMLDAQKQTYGDGLDPEALHPYMWAAKPHYYGATFYNWPYTFGLLFGLGLFARFRDDADAFRDSYDDLLSSTGMAEAAELCARFDIDVRSADFWRGSLDVIRGQIDEFASLAS
jgi:oligoendopeptidase F